MTQPQTPNRRQKAPHPWALLWAAPATLIGLTLGIPMLLMGAHWRWHNTHAEIGGGGLGALMARWQGPRGYAAITLGHLVLGSSTHMLDTLRAHESVHVHQYERWGPLFLPAYLIASGWCLLQGRRAYLDNPFEREALVKARRHLRITTRTVQTKAQATKGQQPFADI